MSGKVKKELKVLTSRINQLERQSALAEGFNHTESEIVAENEHSSKAILMGTDTGNPEAVKEGFIEPFARVGWEFEDWYTGNGTRLHFNKPASLNIYDNGHWNFSVHRLANFHKRRFDTGYTWNFYVVYKLFDSSTGSGKNFKCSGRVLYSSTHHIATVRYKQQLWDIHRSGRDNGFRRHWPDARCFQSTLSWRR